MQTKCKYQLKFTEPHFLEKNHKFQFVPSKPDLLWFLNQQSVLQALNNLRFDCWTHLQTIFTHIWLKKDNFYPEKCPFYPIFWPVTPFFTILRCIKHRKTLYFLKGIGVNILISLCDHHNLLKQRLESFFTLMSP